MPSIEDQIAAENAPSWNPHKHADDDRFVKGVLLTTSTYHGDYGESPILTIDRGDPSPNATPPGRFVNFFAFGTVAEGEVSEKNPQPGEPMAVLYKGTELVKAGANKGKPYPVFKLFVERGGNGGAKPAVPTEPLPFRPMHEVIAEGATKDDDTSDIPF
jgi:hypothetical protein